MVLKYYYSSAAGDMKTKANQQKIEMILSSKKIVFEKIDISSDANAKNEMRNIVGNDKALAPQLCNDDRYCGDFDAFELAVDDEKLDEFLAGKQT